MSVMVTYNIPVMGLGTDFSEFDRPITFASTYTNRFRNITGAAERRSGQEVFTSAAVPGGPNLTRLHEYVDQLGNETLMVSDDSGNIWVNGTNLSQYTNVEINTENPSWLGDIDASINQNATVAQGSGTRPIIAAGNTTTATAFYFGGFINPGSSCAFAVKKVDVSGDTPAILSSSTSSTFSVSSVIDISWQLSPTGRYIAMYLQQSAAPTHYYVIYDTVAQAFGGVTSVNMGNSSGTKQIAWLDSTHLIIDQVSGGIRGIEIFSVSGTTMSDLGFTGVWGAASSSTRVPLSYAQYTSFGSGLINYMTDVSGISFSAIFAVTLSWNGSSVTVGSPYTVASSLPVGSGSGPHGNLIATSSTEWTLCYGTVAYYSLISFVPGASSATVTRPWQQFTPTFGTGTTTQPIYIVEDNIICILQRGLADNFYRISDITLNPTNFLLAVDAVQVVNISLAAGYFMAGRIDRNDIFVGGVGGFTFDLFQIGKIQRSNAVTWIPVVTGKSAVRLISAEADDKLIFVNGVDRNFYTGDAGVTFQELKALITTGTLAGGSSATAVIDGNISNWIGNTLVSNNDIVYNVTQNAYGIVTTVASASLSITAIGSGGTGAGFSFNDQAPGDAYQLIDYVALNVVPNGAGSLTDVGTAGNGTTASVIVVSGVNFANTEIRNGDFIYNTTQGGIAQVADVSANVTLQQSVSGQTSGDALVFLKSAMPIASWIHVHYGRVAYLDARNGHNVIFSAPDDPQDVTTFQQTLDSTSFSFGTQQPEADVLISMETFLSYFVAAGKKNLFIYQGNTPIQDTSQTAINFTPIAFYPNGIASRLGLETNGGDLLHMTVDGLQAVNIGYNAFSVNQNNASVPILNTLRQAINSVGSTDDIQLTYYPRRRWLVNKIGDQCFIMNTQPSYDQSGQQQQLASWHLFNGPWAQNNHYFVRRNGDLLSCGANGMIYFMDSSAATDNGTPIATDLQTAWLRLEEPQITPRIKEGTYIRPVFESSPNIEYTISVRAGLDNYSSDSITVSAGGTGAIGSFIIGTTPIGAGSFAQAIKYPLRWRGEEFRVQFTTQSSATEDIITSFTIFGNVGGRR